MSKKEFILQGFTAKTHKEAIAHLFETPDIKRVIVSVAFVNQSGVELLKEHLSKSNAKTDAFIGIRNGITSIQGAKRLLDVGASLFFVDTDSRLVLFHPKLYFVKGLHHARLVIGSANLTTGGLNNNIEASLAIELDLHHADDSRVVEHIENEFDALVKRYPKHVIPIAEADEIDRFKTAGLLIDENRVIPHPASTATLPFADNTPKIKLEVSHLRRPRVAATKVGDALPVKTQMLKTATGVAFEIVWESKSLTRRDLNIPNGKNTNSTGSFNLDKGMLPENVDHRHYFREKIFSNLIWKPGKTASIEEAYTKFHLVLKGISYGEFDLRIAHTKGRTSVAYQQKNAMTRISWGPLRDYVGQEDLLGRTLVLYRNHENPKYFMLEID